MVLIQMATSILNMNLVRAIWILFFAKTRADRTTAGMFAARKPSGPNGYMDPASEPGYTRPSHDDGTLTTANSLKLLTTTNYY